MNNSKNLKKGVVDRAEFVYVNSSNDLGCLTDPFPATEMRGIQGQMANPKAPAARQRNEGHTGDRSAHA